MKKIKGWLKKIDWKFIVILTLIFLVWRVVLAEITVLGATYTSAPSLSINSSPVLMLKELWTWWDGGFYHDIAATGYPEPANSAFEGKPVRTAFFPMYPFLIRSVGNYLLHGDLKLAQLLISSVLSFAAIIFLALLFKKQSDKETSINSILALLAFPFSYFLASGLSEATFLFFTAGFFYFLLARQNRWIACLFAAGASATRPVGAFLAVILLINYLLDKTNRKKVSDILMFIIALAGPIIYMIYLKTHFGNPLIFLDVQKEWRPNIGGNFILKLAKDFISIIGYSHDLNWHLALMERVAPFMVIASGLYLWLKMKNYEYAVYVLASIALPLLTGTFGSILRFMVVIFPFFFVIAFLSKRYPILLKVYLIIALPLLAVWTIFYNHSVWTG